MPPRPRHSFCSSYDRTDGITFSPSTALRQQRHPNSYAGSFCPRRHKFLTVTHEASAQFPPTPKPADRWPAAPSTATRVPASCLVAPRFPTRLHSRSKVATQAPPITAGFRPAGTGKGWQGEALLPSVLEFSPLATPSGKKAWAASSSCRTTHCETGTRHQGGPLRFHTEPREAVASLPISSFCHFPVSSNFLFLLDFHSCFKFQALLVSGGSFLRRLLSFCLGAASDPSRMPGPFPTLISSKNPAASPGVVFCLPCPLSALGCAVWVGSRKSVSRQGPRRPHPDH